MSKQASDKSVRDCRQSARIKNDYIIITCYIGRSKLYSYNIKIDEWNNISKYGNHDYNKFEFLSSKNTGECERTVESQIRAIDKLFNFL